MPIRREDVKYVAELARLDFVEAEIDQYTRQLDEILSFVEKLNELETEHVAPTSHVLDMKNVMREDEVWESIPREKALSNAPEYEDGFFRVPDVLE